MENKYIMVIDQSTSGSKCLLIDILGNIKYKITKSHEQIYPKEDWVEHNPIEIYENVKSIIMEMFLSNKIDENDILGLALTNQRETVVIWDKTTGKPIYNAIVWQCRRTVEICNELKGYEKIVSEKTGLRLDPYFSATKIKWVLDNIEGAREKANKGDLLLGTIDTWLIWNLTNGKVHGTDYTNASRTLLFNIKDLKWDDELLDIFSIPKSMVPKVYKSDKIFGETNLNGMLNKNIEICGVIGDSQGALFGECCFKKGMAKSTFGTGNSIMVNIGDKYIPSKNGVVTTIASVSKAQGVNYGLEGIINSSGDTINWVKNELGLFKDFHEFNEAVKNTQTNKGIYLIPAFMGLGIPYWNSKAKASIVGISRNTTKENIIRAALESIAYQVKDAISLIENQAQIDIDSLSIDGGVTVNPIYNQFLADLLDCRIEKNINEELSSMGAAYLCGLGLGVWKSIEEISEIQKNKGCFKCKMGDKERNRLYRGWCNAVKSVLYLTDLNNE